MTIAWLEKKVMDLQDQLRSMEAHEAERQRTFSREASSDWNDVQKRSV